MRDLVRLIVWTVVDLIRSRAALEAEILTLRQQISVLRRAAPKKQTFSSIDRLIFVCLYRLLPGVRDALAIVKPETVVKWHRAGFRLYWRWMENSSSSASISDRRAWPSTWSGDETRRPKAGGHSSATTLMGSLRWICSSCRQSRFACSMDCCSWGRAGDIFCGLASQRIQPLNGSQIRSRKHAAGNSLPAISFVTGTGRRGRSLSADSDR